MKPKTNFILFVVLAVCVIGYNFGISYISNSVVGLVNQVNTEYSFLNIVLVALICFLAVNVFSDLIKHKGAS